MKIKLLTTENKVNPIGIDTLRPCFSWQFEDGAEQQTSYRLVVKGEKGEVMWDSGEVFEDACILVPYGGKPLCSSEKYVVNLTAVCKNQTATASGSFEMGLLHREDWLGTWAGTNASFQGNTTVLRRVFEVKDKKIIRARAYVTGLGYHEVFLNGKKVTDRVLAPSACDYGRRMYYITYDITDFLTAGQNCFAVELGYGWYGRKVALVQFFVEYEDGEKAVERSASDGSWWVGSGAYLNHGIYSGEIYDARLNTVDWKDASAYTYLDNGWMAAFYPVVEHVPPVADCLEPIRVCEEILPVCSVKRRENLTVYDFGVNVAGWVKISAKGECGARIKIKYAEKTDENGDLLRKNLRSAASMNEYILSGKGVENYSPRFCYHGFRYVSAEGEGKVDLLSIKACHVHNDVSKTGFFRCDDETLNALHDCAVRTEENNLYSIMTDCPQRDERFCWLNDLTPRLFQNVNNFHLAAMFSKTLRDIADTADENGAIADTAPFMGGFRPADPSCASFLLLGIFSYRYYGDIRPIKEHYENFARWVSFLISRAEGFVLKFSHYGDWVVPECYQDRRSNPEYVSSAFLNWHLRLMAECAKIAGNERDQKKYSRLVRESDKALIANYYRPADRLFANGTQTEQALALEIGFAPKKDRKAIVDGLEREIIALGHHITCGNQGYRHLFYSMCRAGKTELMLKVLKNPDYPGWGYMLKNGATTIWERWEKKMQVEMHSFDHPMFCSFDGIFYNFVGGIRPAEDAVGFDKIIISPDTNVSLNQAECSLETVRGRVSCSWKRVNGGAEILVHIPPTASAKFPFRGRINGEEIEKNSYYPAGEYKIFKE